MRAEQIPGFRRLLKTAHLAHREMLVAVGVTPPKFKKRAASIAARMGRFVEHLESIRKAEVRVREGHS